MRERFGPNRLFLALGMLAAMLGHACTHPGHGRDLERAHLPTDRIVVPGVPFFPQEAYQCGPAALAMVLGWSGPAIGPEALIREVYTPARKGSLQAHIIAAARRRGKLAVVLHGPEALLGELAAGHPVIVLQNLGLNVHPTWHYAVAVGVDRPADDVILHTGTHAARRTGWSRFLYTWERGGYWGLVVLPPGRLPAVDDESAYLQAAVGLEQARQWEAAASAYAAALRRWPENPGAMIGLGTSQVALGNLPAAEDALRRAVAAAPRNGDAANNLAHVLAAQDRLEEALAWSRRAVAIGGPHLSVYRETLGEIEARLQGR